MHPDRLRRASSSGQRSCLQTQLDDNQLCDRAPLPARIREGRALREGVPGGRVLVGSGAFMSETQTRPNHIQVYIQPSQELAHQVCALTQGGFLPNFGTTKTNGLSTNAQSRFASVVHDVVNMQA